LGACAVDPLERGAQRRCAGGHLGHGRLQHHKGGLADRRGPLPLMRTI